VLYEIKKAAGIVALRPPGSSNWSGSEMFADPPAPAVVRLIRVAGLGKLKSAVPPMEHGDGCRSNTEDSN
jgi:hypothetical protein